MRRVMLGLLACCLLAAACDEQSRVDPNATIRIEGTVRAPDGAPLADRPVRLGAGVGTGDGLFAVLTLGLACTSGSCSGKVFDTTTDSAGAYALELKGRDTQSTFGEAVSELLSVSAAPAGEQVSGALVSARFKVQTENIGVPALELVDPGLTVQAAGADVQARWVSPKPGPFRLAFETGSSVPVWEVTTAEGTVSVDPRVLEDTSGRVVVGGGLEDAIEGSTVTIQWRSPGVAYASGAGAPPSRGRACRYTDATGTLSAEATPCSLTDGDLAAVTTAPHLCPSPSDDGGTTTSAPPCPPVAWAVIDLGAPVPAELVVVRGCNGGCAVEVSSDGASYRPAGGGSEGFGSVPLDGSAITSVRVGVTSSASLREVSVWGPRPPDPPLRTLDESVSDKLRAPFGTGGGDDGIPVWLLIAAGVLAACVLVAIGFMVGRLRSQSRPSTPFSTH